MDWSSLPSLTWVIFFANMPPLWCGRLTTLERSKGAARKFLLTGAVLIGVTGCASSSDVLPAQVSSEQVGPLESFLFLVDGFPSNPRVEGNFEESDRINNQMNLELEHAVADCMAERGFTYIPNNWSTFTTVARPEGTFIPRDSRAWAETFGFGMSTNDLPGLYMDEVETRWIADRELERENRRLSGWDEAWLHRVESLRTAR
jgi:hypothetical protein